MFELSQSKSYSWPVAFELPVDGGRSTKQTFDAEFKRIPQSRIKEIQKQLKENALEDDASLAREMLMGWKGIVSGGEEVPFSESARDQLLEVPMVATAIVVAFFESLSGGKRKN